MSHFEKLKISDDIDTIIVYLTAQASMMPDKNSANYKRMLKIVESIKKMKSAYDDIFSDNQKYINELLKNNLLSDSDIKKLLEIPTSESRLPIKVNEILEFQKIMPKKND